MLFKLFVLKEGMMASETITEPGKLITPGKYNAGEARYTIVMDSTQAGVEEKYFSILRFLQNNAPFGLGYNPKDIEKIKDIYTAGETSAYWGAVEQRRAAQIDKFQQLMANVGNMVKTLFQLIREMRIMEERLEYYGRSEKGEEAAEVALKSVWVDMVEGGGKNPGSVIGLAMNVGFVTLPDLFYSIHPKKIEDVEKEVEKLSESFNRKVREVLARKLKQYLIWKQKTYQELLVGKKFKLKYLRQHYHVIKIYLNWLRPYLRNVQRLQMQDTSSDKDIIAAFDTSKIELEIMAMRKEYRVDIRPGTSESRSFEEYFPVIRVQWNYVAIPEMAYQQDYQRGAVHRGRTTIVIDAFIAKKDELENYRKKQEEEDLELLSAVDESLVAMKEDIDKYLKEAGEEEKKEEQKEQRGSIFAPFTDVYKGFKEMFGIKKDKEKRKSKFYLDQEKEAAKSAASADAYIIYKAFKGSHGMLSE